MAAIHDSDARLLCDAKLHSRALAMLRGRAGAHALVPPADPVGLTPLIDLEDAVPLMRQTLRSRAKGVFRMAGFPPKRLPKASSTFPNATRLTKR